MNQRQTNRLNMIESMTAYLTANSTIVSGPAGFGESLDKVKTLASDIRTKENEKSNATTGKTSKKRQSGDELAKQLLKVSAALFLWASKNNNTEIKEIASINKSIFNRLRDADKLNTAKRIYDAANGKDLAFTAVTADDVTQLDTLVTAFKNDIDNFNSGKSKSIAARKSLNEMLDEAVNIIKDELDKYMMQFEISQSEFYNGYKSARVVWDKGGRQKVEAPVEETVSI